MKKDDIKIIIKILKQEGKSELAKLLIDAKGEIDESSTYGSYLFSTISQYLFYLPLENYHKIKKISDRGKQTLLDRVLYLYPHQAEAPEIRSVDFRILREKDDRVLISINERLIDHDFAKEQLDKCDEKIQNKDFDGAISSSGSLLEEIFEDIYKKCTGKSIGTTADLRKAYKKIKTLLKLSDEQYSNESIKAIMRGLSGIISGIDSIRNQLGDRHKRMAKPCKRHAKLCVNSAKIITDFLYETLLYQEGKIKKLYNDLIKILDSNKRFLTKEELMSDQEILTHLSLYDQFLKENVKNVFIRKYKITKFRESDIFFTSMVIFLDQLSEDDINRISNKQKNNRQACGLESFLKLIEEERD